MPGDRVTYITCLYSTASVCAVQLSSYSWSVVLNTWTHHQPIIIREDTSNTADIRYEYVKHTLVIGYVYVQYAMDTSIPTPMSTFPMQFVGKLDVLGLWQFSSYFLYTSAYVQAIRHGVTGPLEKTRQMFNRSPLRQWLFAKRVKLSILSRKLL